MISVLTEFKHLPHCTAGCIRDSLLWSRTASVAFTRTTVWHLLPVTVHLLSSEETVGPFCPFCSGLEGTCPPICQIGCWGEATYMLRPTVFQRCHDKKIKNFQSLHRNTRKSPSRLKTTTSHTLPHHLYSLLSFFRLSWRFNDKMVTKTI